MLLLLLLMPPIPFIFKGADMESAVLSLVPIAAFTSNLFLNSKRLVVPNILFWLIVVVIVHNNWLLIKF
jgi:hypothetical protein